MQPHEVMEWYKGGYGHKQLAASPRCLDSPEQTCVPQIVRKPANCHVGHDLWNPRIFEVRQWLMQKPLLS